MMKIKHKKGYSKSKLIAVEYPCVVWWISQDNNGHVIYHHTITGEEFAKSILDTIQEHSSFVKWLGWESMESYYKHNGLQPAYHAI